MHSTKSKPTVRISLEQSRHIEHPEELSRPQDEENFGEDFGEEQFVGENEEYEECSSDIDPLEDLGRIDLSFPKAETDYSNSSHCYPPSYYTLTAKEKLILIAAESFRQKFVMNYPNRRPLVLAPVNECGIQKFVCTTIRPTGFLHIPLIRNYQACSSFVADFIQYEPLDDIFELPTRLISPASLLRQQHGNSFEMATLLCSMLIGAGFPAVVCSGVARAEIVLNDQRNVEYPHKILDLKLQESAQKTIQTGTKYKLRPMPDLNSHLEENMMEMIKKKEADQHQKRMEALRKEKEALELRPVDKYHYRRSHAWVAIIDNAPWYSKSQKTYINDEGNIEEVPIKVRFIEPSTGFEIPSQNVHYILIESVWNEFNYYVNLQDYKRISEIRWDLRDTKDWEHLLLGEPPEMRIFSMSSDEILPEIERPIEEEKHLDTIRSWVLKLHIGAKEFEERFPNLQKTIYYKKAIHERFSPYSQMDGKVMQLTFFSDVEYKQPIMKWQYFENRLDFLLTIKYTYDSQEIEEQFNEGRNDSLRSIIHSKDPSKTKYFHFYSKPRLDCLNYMEVDPQRIILKYIGRSDLCFHREFEFKPDGLILKKIIEKFLRNTTLPANKDVALRTFILNQRKICIKFHYATGALTASTREFIKPPKPSYGQEMKYEPSLTKSYKASVTDIEPTSLELYIMLLDYLKHEENLQKHCEQSIEEINTILDQRKNEMKDPKLSFHIFDGLRNGTARLLRLQAYLKENEYKLKVSEEPADFLAPYLVPFKHGTLTVGQSLDVYNACLHDLKTRFVYLLNELQRQYEDLTAEAKSMERFLKKFENHFNDYEYDRLVKEARDIGLNRRMVQRRLTITHQHSQQKYETVKVSLLKDPRLNFNDTA